MHGPVFSHENRLATAKTITSTACGRAWVAQVNQVGGGVNGSHRVRRRLSTGIQRGTFDQRLIAINACTPAIDHRDHIRCGD